MKEAVAVAASEVANRVRAEIDRLYDPHETSIKAIR